MMRMKLPHGEPNTHKHYSMPDPDALVASYKRARRVLGARRITANVVLSYEDAAALAALARGYLDLTTQELGQEGCVRRLRDIWRARRARGL